MPKKKASLDAVQVLAHIKNMSPGEQQKLWFMLGDDRDTVIGQCLQRLIAIGHSFMKKASDNAVDYFAATWEALELEVRLKKHRKPARKEINERIIKLDSEGMTDTEVMAAFKEDGVTLKPSTVRNVLHRHRHPKTTVKQKSAT